MRAKGSITVMLSLVLLLMLSLLFTLLESARVRGLQADADRMTQAAAESVFAEYSRALLEDYDLFALDGGYGTDTFSADNAAARMMTFLAWNAEETDGSGTVQIDFFQAEPQSVQLEAWQLLTDEEGAAYYQMACSYAQSALPAAVLSSLASYLMGGDASDEVQEDDSLAVLEEALDALEEEDSYGEEENAELTEEEIAAAEAVSEETKGILETVSELKTKGILTLLTGDVSGLSAQTLSAEVLYTDRTAESGTGVWIQGDGSRLLFQWYLGEKFTSFLDTDGEEDHALQYELEYCYAGNDSDTENLECVAERILLIREGINFAYLLTDTQKQAEAKIVALAIAGVFAVPAILSMVQYAVLAAWAFLESVRDVQILLTGDTLPAVKTAQNWQTDLSISSLTESGTGASGGLTYENYLQILLLTCSEEELISRSLNLIEQNVRLTDGNEAFQVDHCITAASWETVWSADPMFLSLTAFGAQSGIGIYGFVSEGTFRYE